MKAAIIGLAGATLGAEEAALLRRAPPAGVILFARNVTTPAALSRLIDDLRAILPAAAVVMIDQEGGRVARLRPPFWRAHPAAAALGRLYARDPAAGLRAAFLQGALIGAECAASGLDVVTAPVLDLAIPGADAVIGDRAFAGDPEAVAALGAALASGLLAAGVQPVMKHIPGHGRAEADSHLTLPVVASSDLAADVAPFAANAALPWAMTAHILYPALDPQRPATLSPSIIRDVIRGAIGFAGVLVSDDLAMRALTGAPGELAVAALDAGCDLVLHCTGVLAETASLLDACPAITPAAGERLAAARALACVRRDPALLAARDALAAEREALLG